MELKKGDSIPNFKAKDTNGNDFDSQMLIGQKPLVIFYPKTIHRDVPRKRAVFAINTKISKIWVVIGISSDTVESHQKFTKQYNYLYFIIGSR
jgi:peroxiredoxin Q/BCP